jgi:hypothetical protein
MASSPRIARLLLLAAALLLPVAARAAPFSVTYEITGTATATAGSTTVPSIQSGTIVTFPNPGSGPPPLNTAGHSIYVHFLTATAGGGYPGIFQRTFKPTQFPQGAAFRGADQTLRANRRVAICPGGFYTIYGIPYCNFPPGYETFDIRANADGQITRGQWLRKVTAEDTGRGWYSITGQEVASTPEPLSASLLALGGVGLAGAAAASRWLRRRA